jgi:competence protein ComEC
VSVTAPPFWHQAPFTRLLFPLVTGIVTCYYLLHGIFKNAQINNTVYVAAGLSIAGLLCIAQLSSFKKYRYHFIQGVFLQIVFASLGVAVMQKTLQARDQETALLAACKNGTVYIMRIIEPLQLKYKTYKTAAIIESIGSAQHEIKTNIKIIVYVAVDSSSVSIPLLTAGSYMATTIRPNPVPDTHNPGGFNYKLWLFRNEITHQLYVARGTWTLLPTKKSNQYLQVLQQKISKRLQQNITGKQEKAVAAALLIGYKQDIDSDLMKAYSNTGVIHVIAISGLHLGLIYGLLLSIFSWVPNSTIKKWTAPLIILLVLWGFALLTGAGPSIVRAAVMFSFIIIASIVKQNSSILNTLAASAFFLLLLHPFYLWDIGFQLSYAAVLSIVLYQKYIFDSLYFKYKWIQACWQLNALTLSAQILTLPLVVYHFHQFPNYFLLSNFIVVPLSSIILYGCLLLLPFGTIAYLGKAVSVVTSLLISSMNWIIQKMNALPFATTPNLHINTAEVLLFFIIIVSVTLFIQTQKNKWCFYGLTALLIGCSIHSFNLIQEKSLTTLTVWFVPKTSKVTLRYGQQKETTLPIGNSAFTIGHTRFLYIGQVPALKDSSISMSKVDILIVGNLPKSPIPLLAKQFKGALYVFDSSIPLWKMESWKKEAEDLHLRHHFVSQQGAFVHQSSNGKEN